MSSPCESTARSKLGAVFAATTLLALGYSLLLLVFCL
jgi:hypothetical protein